MNNEECAKKETSNSHQEFFPDGRGENTCYILHGLYVFTEGFIKRKSCPSTRRPIYEMMSKYARKKRKTVYTN